MITEVLLPVCIAGIMVVLGLSLTPDDFRRVVAIPRGVGIGLVNLLVISPLLAFGIAELTGLSPELAVGLVLLGASPGGAMANLLTHLARGEVALSVTMTAISSILALVTVPLYLGLAIDHFGADAGRRLRHGRDRGAGVPDHGGAAEHRHDASATCAPSGCRPTTRPPGACRWACSWSWSSRRWPARPT